MSRKRILQRKTPYTERMIAAQVVRRGYPGIQRLRTVMHQPLLHKLSYALRQTLEEVRAEWKVLPPRYFWPTVRMYAEEWGINNTAAFIRLANQPIDLTAPLPHPLLHPRD